MAQGKPGQPPLEEQDPYAHLLKRQGSQAPPATVKAEEDPYAHLLGKAQAPDPAKRDVAPEPTTRPRDDAEPASHGVGRSWGDNMFSRARDSFNEAADELRRVRGEEPEKPGEFIKGVRSALGGAAASAARVLDVPEYQEEDPDPKRRILAQRAREAGEKPREPGHMLRDIAEVGDKIGEDNKARVPSYRDVHGAKDLGDYVAGQAGQAVGSTAPSLVALLAGGMVPAAAASYLQNAGDVEKELEDLGADPEKADLVAKALGVPVAALDVMGLDVMAGALRKRLTKAAGQAGAAAIAKRTVPQMAKEVGKRVVKAGAAESGTEALQEGIQYAGSRAATAQPITAAEGVPRVIDAAVGGLTGGVTLGGASAVSEVANEQADAYDHLLKTSGEKVQMVDRDQAIEQQVQDEHTPATVPPPVPTTGTTVPETGALMGTPEWAAALSSEDLTAFAGKLKRDVEDATLSEALKQPSREALAVVEAEQAKRYGPSTPQVTPQVEATAEPPAAKQEATEPPKFTPKQLRIDRLSISTKKSMGGMVFRRVLFPDDTYVDVMVKPPKGGVNAWGQGEEHAPTPNEIKAKAIELRASRPEVAKPMAAEASDLQPQAQDIVGMPTEREGEIITGPAIMLPDGRKFAGGMMHDDILNWAKQLSQKMFAEGKIEEAGKFIQDILEAYGMGSGPGRGFVTNQGRFLTAEEFKQLMAQERQNIKSGRSSELMSRSTEYGQEEVRELTDEAQEEGLEPGGLFGDPAVQGSPVQAMPLAGTPTATTRRVMAFNAFVQNPSKTARILRALGFTRSQQRDLKSLHQIATDLFKTFNVPYRQGRGLFKQRKALGWFNQKTWVVRMEWAGNARTAFHEFGHFVSTKFLHNPTMKGAILRQAPGLNLAIRKELTAMGKALYGNRKPSGGYMEEGIAEWARYYVIDPAHVQQNMPEFSKFMETTVFPAYPELKAILDVTKEHWDAYQAAPATVRADAMMADDPKSLWRKVLDWVAADDKGIVAAWFEDTPIIKEAVEAMVELSGGQRPATLGDAYKILQSTRHIYGFVEEELATGIVDVNTGKPVTRGYFEIWKEIPGEKRQAFRRYLMAHRVQEEFEKGVTATDMTETEAAQIIAEYDKTEKSFKKLAEDIWAISQALIDQRVQVGLLTEEEGALIKSVNKRRYGPMHREFEDGEIGRPNIASSGRRMPQNSAGTPALRGSPRNIIPPDEAMVRDIYDTAKRVHAHRGFLALVKQALRTTGAGLYLEEVPTPKDQIKVHLDELRKQMIAAGMDPYAFFDKARLLSLALHGVASPAQQTHIRSMSTEQLVNYLVNDLGSDIDHLIDNFQLSAVLTAWRNKRQAGPGEVKDLVLPAIINGQRRWFAVKDKALYDAIMGLGPHELVAWSNIVGSMTEKATRTLRAGATLTFDFMAGNWWRDAFQAASYTQGEGKAKIPFYLFARGLMLQMTNPEMTRRWRREMGQGGAMISRDRENVQNLIERATQPAIKTLKGKKKLLAIVERIRPIEALRAASEVVENATRLGETEAVYKKELKAGKPDREAFATGAHAAGDVTLRFSGGGKASRQVNRAVAFFNVSMLDLMKFQTEFITTKDPARRKAIAMRAVALITLPSVALAALQGDDEEYLAIPQWQRNAHWIWVQRDENGVVKHIWRFPKPNGILGFVFGTIPERLTLFAKNQDPEMLTSLAGALGQTIIPNLVPTIVAPILENLRNRSTLRGSKIVPRSRENLVASEQVADYTGDFARQVGQMATHLPGMEEGVSPAKFENLMQGYTGTLGRTLLENVADPATRVARKVTGQPAFPTPTKKVADWPTKTPLVRRFSVREPLEDAETVQRLYREYFSAEAKRTTFRDLVKRREFNRARKYLDDNRQAIASVGTESELGPGRQGPLREAFEMLQDMRKNASKMPPEQRANIGRRVRAIAESPGVRATYQK